METFNYISQAAKACNKIHQCFINVMSKLSEPKETIGTMKIQEKETIPMEEEEEETEDEDQSNEEEEDFEGEEDFEEKDNFEEEEDSDEITEEGLE